MKKAYKIACIASLSISVIAMIIWRVYDIELAELFVWGGIAITVILLWLNSLK
tara:strand:- start:716 stop:874 length:159 start_codon:yes stop_codon:yes gene_type:complete